MGKKSKGKTPTPPDPRLVAQAQTQSNIDTARFNTDLNRLDEVTPFGNVTFDPIEGTNRFRRTESLSPESQQIFGNELAIGNAATQLGLQNFGNVAAAQAQPFSLEGLPGLQSEVPGGQGILGGLDFSGVPGIPGQEDFGAERQRIEDLLFENQSGRLNTRFGRERADLDQSLANRGLRQDTELGQAEADRFDRMRNEAFGDARISSILAGSQEQGRLFNQGLAARQQGVGEVGQQGAFANQAQAQQFGQGLTGANLANQARQQGIQERAFERSQPINELSAILGAAPGVPLPQFSPTFTSSASPTNIAGIEQSGFQNQMDVFNAQQQKKSGKLGGLGSLIGGAASFIPGVGPIAGPALGSALG